MAASKAKKSLSSLYYDSAQPTIPEETPLHVIRQGRSVAAARREEKMRSRVKSMEVDGDAENRLVSQTGTVVAGHNRKGHAYGTVTLDPGSRKRAEEELSTARRLKRLKQVREQERLIALQIRQRASAQKERERAKLADTLRGEWEEERQQEVRELSQQYHRSVQALGAAHENAHVAMQQLVDDAQEEIECYVGARATETDRFDAALGFARAELAATPHSLRARAIERLRQVREAENTRALHVAEMGRSGRARAEAEPRDAGSEAQALVKVLGYEHDRSGVLHHDYEQTRFHEQLVHRAPAATSQHDGPSAAERAINLCDDTAVAQLAGERRRSELAKRQRMRGQAALLKARVEAEAVQVPSCCPTPPA